MAPEKKSKYKIPEVIRPEKLADYLEIMSIAVFQASLSWALVQGKWENFKTAFDHFDPEKIANYDAEKIAELMQNEGILRSEKKINATIKNAKAILALDQKFGSFSKYLHSFNSYSELSRDMRKQFSYLGELSVYYFLFCVGEEVPDFDEWVKTIEGNHPRMKEMVEQAGF